MSDSKNTRMVEFIVPWKRNAETVNKGERRLLPKDEADTLIKVGACSCVETGEQHELQPGSHKLEVNSVKQKALNQEKA